MPGMQTSERKPFVKQYAADTPTQVTVQTHPEWLTQEKYDGLSAGKISPDTLTAEQLDDWTRFIADVHSGKATAPAAAAPAAPAPSDKAPATPAPAETPAAAPASTPSPAPASAAPPAAAPTPAPAAPAPAAADGPKSPDEVPLPTKAQREEFFRKFHEKAATANTVTQLRDELRKMKEDTAAKLAEIQKRPVTQADPDDPLAANSVRGQAEKVAKLEEQLALVTGMLNKQTEALESFHSQSAATLQAESSLLGLERFQYETQASDVLPAELALATTVPLSMLNAELQDFAKRIGGLEYVNKYLSDATYKAQVEAQGIKLSEGFIKNLDTFNLIHDLNEEVRVGKAPDHMTAYLSHLFKSGKLAAGFRNAKLAGAGAVATGIASQTTATPTLEPGKEAAPKAVGWTASSAREWIRLHPDIKPGSADDATFQQILELMNAGQLR